MIDNALRAGHPIPDALADRAHVRKRLLDQRQPVPPAQDLHRLFPDTFTDSDLGPIPEGWEVKRLPEAIEVNPRRQLKKGTFAPYLDMKSMPTGSARASDRWDREFKSGTRFVNGDVLLARITPCLENGKTAYVDFLDDGQVGWGSTEYIVFRSRPPLRPEHAYFLCRSAAFRDHAILNMTGTSGRQRVPASCFDRYDVVVPAPAVCEAFGKLARGIMVRMKVNDEESRTLASIRDALLPKIISGEIRVKDAEQIIRRCV